MSRRRSSNSPIYDFVTFRLMITPLVISIVFWVGVLGCLATGFRMVVLSFDQTPSAAARDAEREREAEYLQALRRGDKAAAAKVDGARVEKPATAFSPGLFAAGLAVMVFGPILVRIACELDIILFSIHDELKAANDRARYTG